MAPFVHHCPHCHRGHREPEIFPDLPAPRYRLVFTRHPFGQAETPSIQDIQRPIAQRIIRRMHRQSAFLSRQMNHFFAQLRPQFLLRPPFYRPANLNLNITLPAYLCGGWAIMTRSSVTTMSSELTRVWVWKLVHVFTVGGDGWMLTTSRVEFIVAPRVEYGNDRRSSVLFADMYQVGEITALIVCAVGR